MRFLPEPNYDKTGSKGVSTRHDNLLKTIAVKQSLSLTVNSDIKKLDLPAEDSRGNEASLRDILMDIRYPINAKDDSAPGLFFCLDRIESGEYEHSVYVVAYNDRAALAASFADVLPQFIAQFYGKHLLPKWFHAFALPQDGDTSEPV